MRGINKYLAGSVLSLAMFFSPAVNAMQIPQYDQMDYRDQGHYVTLLVKGVYENLIAQGETEQANKLLTFFQDGSDKGGPAQFSKNLEMAKALNQQNAANPSNQKPVYEVEHAMALTLKNQGIVVPVPTLLAINKDFHPAYR